MRDLHHDLDLSQPLHDWYVLKMVFEHRYSQDKGPRKEKEGFDRCWQSTVSGNFNSLMSSSASCELGRDLIELHVLCLNGEGCRVKLNASALGLEVYLMVSKQLPPKKGGKSALHHIESQLMLHKTLQEQGIVGKAATLSCTYVPKSDPAKQSSELDIWRELQPEPRKGDPAKQFTQSLETVVLPNSLLSLRLQNALNQSLEKLTLPSCQSLTFQHYFKQILEKVTCQDVFGT